MPPPRSACVRGATVVFTFVNAYFERLAGGGIAAGQDDARVHPESESARFMELIDRVYQTGAPASGTEVPAHARTPDGASKELFLNITYQPLLDAEGRVDSVVSFAVDVTGQVEAAPRSEGLTAALRESETRYRSFVNQSTEGIWRTELEQPIAVDTAPAEQLAALYRDAYLAECNDAMARMYGYERGDELVGARLGELLVPEGPLNAATCARSSRTGIGCEGIESQKEIPYGARASSATASSASSRRAGCGERGVRSATSPPRSRRASRPRRATAPRTSSWRCSATSCAIRSRRSSPPSS